MFQIINNAEFTWSIELLRLFETEPSLEEVEEAFHVHIIIHFKIH